jgi:AcrR family transcriptional regulator
LAGRPSKTRRGIALNGGSRQAARTANTCRKLLDAAERVFARDGFEAARLEDISAGAGYTRGAFYANFQSKEDIFFALLEQFFAERMRSAIAAMNQHNDPEKKLAALRQHYAEQARNRRLVLLSLEFKLFALRHPEAHARLQDRHRRLRTTWADLLSQLAEALGKTFPISTPAVSTCLGALAHGLLLEHLVDHKFLTEGDVRLVLGLFFDAIFGQHGSSCGAPREAITVTRARRYASNN